MSRYGTAPILPTNRYNPTGRILISHPLKSTITTAAVCLMGTTSLVQPKTGSLVPITVSNNAKKMEKAPVTITSMILTARDPGTITAIETAVNNMSGKLRGTPRWKNEKAISKIREIIDKYPNQKGAIHTSSNEQAFWIMDNLRQYNLVFVGGESRNEVLREFNESNDDEILIGASIKDGVDLKGDLCRFQIMFKVPYPQLNEQVKYRKSLDNSWYYYQAVMAIMQAYGRGIRDKDDYCDMYIIDADFKKLFYRNRKFFNEYFAEAIKIRR